MISSKSWEMSANATRHAIKENNSRIGHTVPKKKRHE
jgi:hypothetical protein